MSLYKQEEHYPLYIPPYIGFSGYFPLKVLYKKEIEWVKNLFRRVKKFRRKDEKG